jgi:alkyl sulfatase BDS1-like metallo-beta-lactamase superfamily hydrolase
MSPGTWSASSSSTKQDEFDSIHPSLLRIARLNNNYGLYEVIPGIYQVRGFDLSDITFVRGKTGWIVFDPLVSAETVRAAWKLFQEHVGEGLPVSAVIYSHTHGDHWGGVRGSSTREDVRLGQGADHRARDFMDFTISENVYAGNAMNRRLFYQYGLLLPASAARLRRPGARPGRCRPARRPDRADPLCVEADRGVRGRRRADDLPEHAEHRSAAEMNTYIPGHEGAVDGGERHATLHNIYTLRGAQVRDPLNWSKYIAEALTASGWRPRSCSPRTTGRAGAMSASRKCCAPSATSTPT